MESPGHPGIGLSSTSASEAQGQSVGSGMKGRFGLTCKGCSLTSVVSSRERENTLGLAVLQSFRFYLSTQSNTLKECPQLSRERFIKKSRFL